MLQRSHVVVQYAFHVIRTETLNELLAYAATLAFARLHYFSLTSKVLEVGCWQVMRATAILNIAKKLYLSVLTNKRSLSPYLSLLLFLPLRPPTPLPPESPRIEHNLDILLT